MKQLRGCYRLAALSLIALFCSTTPLGAQPPREQPRFGGVLKVAMIGEPPSLDPLWNAVVITRQIMRHVFETLYTVDEDWSPIPYLAEGHTVTDGGRQYTITLCKGLRFHNGKETTAADVVASLNRWGRMATGGKALWKSVEAVAAKGPYEVVIHLKEPSGVQNRPRRQAAARGGRLQDRPSSPRLCDVRAAPQQTGALRCVLDQLPVGYWSRPGGARHGAVQLARLVVPRGEGPTRRRAGPGDGPGSSSAICSGWR
jgi:hypothetical protein